MATKIVHLTEISNLQCEGEKYTDTESGEKMKALVWIGKNDVRVNLSPTPLISDTS